VCGSGVGGDIKLHTGWSWAHGVVTCMAPIVAAAAHEFKWDSLRASGHANASMMLSISFATVVGLVYVMRRTKSAAVLPLLYVSLAAHAFYPALQSVARQLLHLDESQALAADLAASALAALSSRALYALCSR